MATPDLPPRSKSTVLANQGLCLEQLGRLDEAVSTLETAVSADPGNETAAGILAQLRASKLLGSAVAAAEGKRFTEALGLFEAAGAADPSGDAVWRYNVAEMLNKLGRFEEALAHVEAFRAAEADEDGASLPLLGELLCRSGRWADAKAALGEAVALGLDLPLNLYYNYGVALMKCEDLVGARAAFEDLIAYSPNYGMAYDCVATGAGKG